MFAVLRRHRAVSGRETNRDVRITATQLEQWADTREAQGLLPVLVRRLVSATAATTALAIPGGDSVGEPGWDGYTQITQGNAWVPEGDVRWEMGCSEKVDKKAKGDFRKRTDGMSAEIAKVTTYVFVSPRRWRGKSAWQTGAAKEGKWREVKAYDANDLEAWLETAPGVTLWLGELLGLSGNGIESLERYWDAWSHQTQFPISKAALFGGRDAEKDTLSDALSKSPRLIAIQADSREEAVAFVCAHLLEHGLAERAACITAPEGWRFVDANAHLSVGLAASPEVAQQRAPKDGFTLIVPLSTGDKATYFSGAAASAAEAQHHIVLERPRAEQFEDALGTMGEEVTDATRLARATGRSWSVYRRLRAQNPGIRRPAWMSDPAARTLVAVTLVGGWNGGRQGDRNCLESITQTPYDEFEAGLRHIARLDDSPILQIGSVWKAKAPLELLYLFGPEITAGELRRFFSVAEAILAAPDPALELEESKRWMAAVYGKVRQESGLVIDAIADALAKLRVYAENSADPNAAIIMDGVDEVVRKLLDDADGERWLSLSGVLRELAEASPDEFITAIEKSLRRADAPVRRLLTETGESGAFGRCWHADLLWALEVLAWYPKRLARVATILAELVSTPIKGNWVNTPQNTLSSLFRVWWPQTTTNWEDRIAIIDRLLQTHNASAWALLYSLVPRYGRFASANAHPHWRDDDAGATGPGEAPEIGPYIAGIGTRLIEQAIGNPERIARLLEILGQFEGQYREDIIRLIETAIEFSDDGREIVRASLRHYMHWHLNSKAKEEKQVPGENERLIKAYDALTPQDIVSRHKWIFADRWVQLPKQRDDYAEDHEEIQRLRVIAVQEIFTERSWGGLTSLAKESGDPWALGWAIATAGFPQQALWVWAIAEHKAGGCSYHNMLVSGILHATSTEYLASLLQSSEKNFSRDEDFSAFLACAPFDRTTWNIVEQSKSAVQDAYWQAVQPGYLRGDAEDVSYVVDHLIAVDRPRTAFRLVEHNMKAVESQRLLALLNAIRTGAEPTGVLPDGWYIRNAIEVLKSSEDVSRRDLALLEFSYFSVYSHGDEPAKALYAEMLSDPTLFMEFITLVYRRRNGPPEPIDESLHTAAEAAGSVLHTGRGVPGLQNDGSIDDSAFGSWVESVRALSKEQDRVEVTDRVIGQWLSSVLPASDGAWPPPVVRDLLDREDASDIRRGFAIGVMNNRGVTSRAYDEGGTQERALVDKYRKYAREIQISHPRAAEMVEKIAESYENEARQADIDAKLRVEGH